MSEKQLQHERESSRQATNKIRKQILEAEEMISQPKNGKNLKELPGCIGSKEQQESSMRITQSPKTRMASIRLDQTKLLEGREVRSN